MWVLIPFLPNTLVSVLSEARVGTCLWAVRGEAGWPTGVAQLCDINSLHKWPKITLAVIAAVTSSLTLGKHYLFLSCVSKKKHLTKFDLLELQPVFEKLTYIVCQSTVDCKTHMWSTKDTESVLPMMCTSHLHMQCKFVSSELTATDNRNGSVPEKRMNVFISLIIGVSAD